MMPLFFFFIITGRGKGSERSRGPPKIMHQDGSRGQLDLVTCFPLQPPRPPSPYRQL